MKRKNQETSSKVRKIAKIGMLAAMATALMFIELPLPFLPPFLKLDISSVPIMIGSFMFGPVAGVSMAFVKAFVHALSTQTAGVGELADFIITSTFAISAGLIYKYNKSKKGALIASIVSVFTIIITGAITNYYLLIPFYAKTIMPLDAILAACQAINPNITSLSGYILFGVVPFNAIKGIVVATITFVLYKKVSHLFGIMPANRASSET